MEKMKTFLKRKDIEISLRRYGIDALGAMAQGLFCSLLIGTIINTIGTQFHIPFLTMAVATVNDTQYTVGSLASAMSGPAMAVAIGYALHCPPLVLFSLIICLSVSRPVVPSVLTRAFGMKRSTLRQVAVFPSNDDLQCWRTVVVSFCRLRYIRWSLRGR